MATDKMNVIAECWRIYSDAVMPPGRVHPFAHSTFYAGVAFMFDLMMANVDDEDAACAMLGSVHDELDQYSHDLAARSGVDLDALRAEIAAQLKAKRTKGGIA